MVLDYLEDHDSDLEDQLNDDENTGVTYCNITVVPPTEGPGVDTDEDSDASDNEHSGDFNHLPKRILSSESEVSVGKRSINLGGKRATIVDVSFLNFFSSIGAVFMLTFFRK